jgi:regulator of ribosome biosynthesis
LDDGCLGHSLIAGLKTVRFRYYPSYSPLLKDVCGRKSILVEKDIPPDVDAGFLTVTDTNPLDKESYECVPSSTSDLGLVLRVFFYTPSHEREVYLQENARDGVQLLFASIFSLPTVSSPEGPLGQLPPPTTQLPRAKPLPKPKPPTKWERFARAKGIQSQRRDRKVWDEESQAWVPRWGWKGRNKAEETQWLHEVPANAGTFVDSFFFLFESTE